MNTRKNCKFILLTMYAILTIACKSDNWKLRQADGIRGNNEDLSKLVIADETTGYLFGERDNEENENHFIDQNAVIYRTGNAGTSWQSVVLGYGVFIDACRVGDRIFALKNIYSGDRVDSVGSSEIYCSTKSGNNWRRLTKINQGLQNILFSNPKIGFLISRYNRSLIKQVYRTTNGGKSWTQTPFRLYNTNKFYASPNGDLWSLTSPDITSASFDILRENKINPDREREEALPNFRAVSFTGDANGNLWFLGIENNTKDILVMKRTTSGAFKKVTMMKHETGLGPEQIYVFGDVINVLLSKGASEIPKNTSFPTGVYTFQFIRSEDGGQTWRKERLPEDNRIEPIDFYGKRTVWIYTGGQNIELRQ